MEPAPTVIYRVCMEGQSSPGVKAVVGRIVAPPSATIVLPVASLEQTPWSLLPASVYLRTSLVTKLAGLVLSATFVAVFPPRHPFTFAVIGVLAAVTTLVLFRPGAAVWRYPLDRLRAPSDRPVRSELRTRSYALPDVLIPVIFLVVQLAFLVDGMLTWDDVRPGASAMMAGWLAAAAPGFVASVVQFRRIAKAAEASDAPLYLDGRKGGAVGLRYLYLGAGPADTATED